MITLNGSALPPPPPKPKLTRRTWGGNQAGNFTRLRIVKVLCNTPNLTMRELSLMLPDMDIHTLRYNVARGLKLGLFTMTGKPKSGGVNTPRYSVNEALSDRYLQSSW